MKEKFIGTDFYQELSDNSLSDETMKILQYN
jgi:hypothetical protein